MHWSLFVFFADAENASTFFEFALEPGYSFMIDTVCIHLLRYVIASLILGKSNMILKQVLPIIDKIRGKYNDSFVSLIEILGQSFTYNQIPIQSIKKVYSFCIIGL